MVLTSSPFGRTSSINIVNAEGQNEREAIESLRAGFRASTSRGSAMSRWRPWRTCPRPT